MLEISPNGIDWIDAGLSIIVLEAPRIESVLPSESVPAGAETLLEISGSGLILHLPSPVFLAALTVTN